MQRIIDGVYGIEGLTGGRVYVFVGQDGLVLVDTGIPGSLPRIQKELQSINYSLQDIKHILITHAHFDHIGSVAAIKRATGARIYAYHYFDSDVIQGEAYPRKPDLSQLRGLNRLIASQLTLPRTEPAHVDQLLEEGDTLDALLPGLTVIATPGHTPGHCSFWHPERRLLFAGDAIVRLTHVQPPLAIFTSDLGETHRSIKKLAAYDVETICMGHGKPIVRDAASIIRKLAESL